MRSTQPRRSPSSSIPSGRPGTVFRKNTITAIAQTPDGYLWLGTREGLARFDGVRFTVYTNENTPALAQSQILSLLVDREGRLWIGTWGGGLTKLQNGAFTRFGADQGLPNERSVPHRHLRP